VHAQFALQGGDIANFSEALERFESAKGVYVGSGYAFMVTLIDQQIDLIRKAKASRQ
jgi:hypothetical protein